MKRQMSLIVLAALLAGLLAGCGATPAPTAAPATQTPWIIIVTATPGAEEVSQVEPTQTARIVVVTATVGKPKPAVQPTETPAPPRPSPTPTVKAGTTPKATTAATKTTAATAQASATPSAPAGVTATEPATTSTATTQPPAGATATRTAQPAPATATATGAALTYPAPVLREPPNEAPAHWDSAVVLEWERVGDLAGDEYYCVQLEAVLKETTGAVWYGDYFYTKDDHYVLADSAIEPFHPTPDRGKAWVYWWVRVVRKTGEDAAGKPIGVDVGWPSGKFVFIADTKP